MLSEQITVTTTPTSIQQLIATARSSTTPFIPAKCVGIMLRYAAAETATITLTDATEGNKPGSDTGAVVLDSATENLIATTLSQFSIEKALLNSSAGNITVHIIITQTLL